MRWVERAVLIISVGVLAVLALAAMLAVVWLTVGISYTRADGARVTIKGDVTTIEWPNGHGPVCYDCWPWPDGEAPSQLIGGPGLELQEFDKRIIWVESR